VLDSYGALVFAKYYTNNGGATTITNLKFSKTGNYFLAVFEPSSAIVNARFAYISASGTT
jgi:hypothetical protein